MEPENDPEYLAYLHKLAGQMGLDPRFFQSVRMSDPRCDDCRVPGPRLICYACPKDEIAPDVRTRRCKACFEKHGEAVHGNATGPQPPSLPDR